MNDRSPEVVQKDLGLRQWIAGIREFGLLKEVRGADWNLEIGVLTELNAKRNKYTLLFDEIKGYQKGFRLITGALLDAKRLAYTLGLSPNVSNMELVRLLKERVTNKNEGFNDTSLSPEFISNPACFENILKGHEVNLLLFPAPKWHENDGGQYLGTADLMITQDPESGAVHLGVYRLMVHNKEELGVHMDTGHNARSDWKKYIDSGKPCPVAISLGHHPFMFAVAGMEVPLGISKYAYAAAIKGSPYRVFKGPTTGLPIPADSEIVLEGYITNEIRDEGPFGEFMGYYAGGVFKNPVIKIEAIYFKNNPIILGTAPGRPPYDYSYYRCPMRAAVIWDILERAGIRNVTGVWCHEQGYSRAFTVVSLKQAYSGHSRQAGFVACQCRPGVFGGRYVVVVDDDIDPSNLDDVIWAICTRSDPATDIEIIRNSWGTPLDPLIDRTAEMKIEECTSSRAIIFACRPFPRLLRGTFPKVVESSAETRRKFEEKWQGVLWSKFSS
jgi:UbiD family decarboxylase